MRFNPTLCLLLLAFPGSLALHGYEAASEIRGFVEVQVAAGHDTPLPPNSEEVAARLASVSMSLRTDAFHAKYWQACERELERHEPDYKD